MSIRLIVSMFIAIFISGCFNAEEKQVNKVMDDYYERLSSNDLTLLLEYIESFEETSNFNKCVGDYFVKDNNDKQARRKLNAVYIEHLQPIEVLMHDFEVFSQDKPEYKNLQAVRDITSVADARRKSDEWFIGVNILVYEYGNQQLINAAKATERAFKLIEKKSFANKKDFFYLYLAYDYLTHNPMKGSYGESYTEALQTCFDRKTKFNEKILTNSLSIEDDKALVNYTNSMNESVDVILEKIGDEWKITKITIGKK